MTKPRIEIKAKQYKKLITMTKAPNDQKLKLKEMCILIS